MDVIFSKQKIVCFYFSGGFSADKIRRRIRLSATAWGSTCWHGDATVRTLDLRSSGRGFDSWSGRYQVVTTWMGDCADNHYGTSI